MAPFAVRHDSVNVTGRPPLLFGLCQELQDIIFNLAYPLDPNVKVITKRFWQEQELQKSRANRVPFPSLKISEWMVSKQFLEAAARAWVGNQLFEDVIMRTVDPRGNVCSLIAKYARRGTARYHPLCTMPLLCFKRLQSLQFTVAAEDFTLDMYNGHKDPREDVFLREDLEKSQVFKELRGMRGLKELTLIPRLDFWDSSFVQFHKDIFARNISALQEHLISIVTQSKLAKVEDDASNDDWSSAEGDESSPAWFGTSFQVQFPDLKAAPASKAKSLNLYRERLHCVEDMEDVLSEDGSSLPYEDLSAALNDFDGYEHPDVACLQEVAYTRGFGDALTIFVDGEDEDRIRRPGKARGSRTPLNEERKHLAAMYRLALPAANRNIAIVSRRAPVQVAVPRTGQGFEVRKTRSTRVVVTGYTRSHSRMKGKRKEFPNENFDKDESVSHAIVNGVADTCFLIFWMVMMVQKLIWPEKRV